MKKDDIVTLTIDDIGTNGEGIGRTEGITLFIKDALPGDMVRAKIMKMKKTYGYARLMEILKESTMRTIPPCPEPVSYTHLDVYKRQDSGRSGLGGFHAGCQPQA